MNTINETHDPALESWVASAQSTDSDFPLQNLPFGVFRTAGSQEPWRGGVAIGDQILDLAALQASGVVRGTVADALQAAAGPALNPLMGLGPAAASELRLALSRWLRKGADEKAAIAGCLVPQARAEHGLPARIGDYTDFYVGIHHATAVGRLCRPDAPLLPNYQWVPIGYHGRASTVVPSGRPFIRPRGQLKGPDDPQPRLAPTQRLDFELELGLFVGRGNGFGEPIPLADAESHLFGITLFNDWSARDVQAWEYQPLGPFLSKSFASTLSPWVVTMEALAPFRRPFVRPPQHPAPLPYLDGPVNRASGAIDIELGVSLQTAGMREAGLAPHPISQSNFADAAYWTAAQLVTHHTVNGCALAPGDLFGSGTLSGPDPAQAGSLLELSQGGKQPITLPNGEQRVFLADGDRLILAGWCRRDGFRRIGFGPCEATVLPAVAQG